MGHGTVVMALSDPWKGKPGKAIMELLGGICPALTGAMAN